MDDIYQIEDIPLTKNRERSTKLSKTLAMLEVGQSFLVPEPLTADDLKKIRSNAYQWGQRKGVKISTRAILEELPLDHEPCWDIGRPTSTLGSCL